MRRHIRVVSVALVVLGFVFWPFSSKSKAANAVSKADLKVLSKAPQAAAAFPE